MTLEQLRIFVGVAERQHVTAAAKALHVTQSAASASIASLEERHGVKLFHRVGRGIVLTEAGQHFLDEARGVLARAGAAEKALQELADLERGSLRLVASQTVAAYWLPPLLAQFRLQHPKLAIELTIGNTKQAAQQVHDGDADIGIVEGEIDDPVLAHWPIGGDRLTLVQAGPFEDAGVGAEWLRRSRWVLREPGSGTRSAMEARLRMFGIDPSEIEVALVLPSNESVRSAVEAGAGIAALSSLVVAPALAAGTLHAVPLEFDERLFHGLRHKERYRSRAADLLLEMIKSRSRLKA